VPPGAAGFCRRHSSAPRLKRPPLAPIKSGAAVRNTYLVCYDISNDLRLRRVHKTMVGFGDRVQYSVFECRFSAADLARCKHALAKLIHHRDDQVLFVNLGPSDGRGDRVISSIGRAHSTIDSSCIVIDAAPVEARGTKRNVEAALNAQQKRLLHRDEENE
jgi:CRISPR-associated protein Cas2